MEEKEKKSFHPIRAYILIAFFSLLIILPPLFRLFLPNMNSAVSKYQDTIMNITCTRDYPQEQLTETVIIRYINTKIDQTRITYEPIKNTNSNASVADDTLTPSQEIAYFTNIPGATIETKDNKTVIVINQNTIDQNKDNVDLKNNYFNNERITQKLYFTNRYFSCEETTV